MGLSIDVTRAPTTRLARIWSAACDDPTDFSSLASAQPGIGFATIDGTTTVHLRGPATRATTLSCPRDAEFFGADFRLGTYLPSFPPGRLANLKDVVLPTLPDGRILLDGRAWEKPNPENVDVFVDRLERAGLLAFDPLVEPLSQGGSTRTVPERTAQSRFARAVGLSRRRHRLIERARHATRLLGAGAPIADVVTAAGYYDQPHLTRALRELIGHTPLRYRSWWAVPGPGTLRFRTRRAGGPVLKVARHEETVESTYVSLDGKVSGEQFWTAQGQFRDDRHQAYNADLLAAADALVLGRMTFEVFAATWPGQAGELADSINSLPKYVASRTLTDATWNAEILPGDAVEAVGALKESGDGTLLKYGTGPFSRALIEAGQLDELHLWMYPFIAGAGDPLLPGIATTHLDLARVTEVGNGAVLLVYTPKR